MVLGCGWLQWGAVIAGEGGECRVLGTVKASICNAIFNARVNTDSGNRSTTIHRAIAAGVGERKGACRRTNVRLDILLV